MRLYYDDQGIVRLASTAAIITNLYKCVDVDAKLISGNPIGRRIIYGRPPPQGIRLAMMCNWGDACGIATYSRFLMDALRPLVDDVKIFAEDSPLAMAGRGENGDYDVDYCWRRGQSMSEAMRRIVAWRPSIVLIQHEFGIFPKAPYLLQTLQKLNSADVPYVVTLHSVYEHLDKVVCTGAMRSVVVHSESGRDCLRRLGHSADICVIPHGCLRFDGDVHENFNITYTPYAVVQFGFGFAYKGVDVALEAIARLKRDHPAKYDGETPVHYCYLCSESQHTKEINNAYYRSLVGKIDSLGLGENAVVIRGYQTEAVLDQYLRTYKMAIFPYLTSPKNVVYGASGAIRLAMANRIPTIASSSCMFDDLEGVLPRPDGPGELAAVMDRLFSDHRKREALLSRQDRYVGENIWSITAGRYLSFLREHLHRTTGDEIYIG